MRQQMEAAARAQEERQARHEQRRALAVQHGVPDMLAIEDGPYELAGDAPSCDCGFDVASCHSCNYGGGIDKQPRNQSRQRVLLTMRWSTAV